MMWFVMIIFAILIFKLGMLTVTAAMLVIALKTVFFINLLFVIGALWKWFRNRNGKNSVYTLRKDQWRHI